MIGIYKITNKINNKVYIGLSVSIKDRFAEHKRNAYNKDYKGYDYPLYRAIRKYGLDNFIFTVIEECDREILKEREIFYIAKYKSNNSRYGYNQNSGGDAPAYVRISNSIVDTIINMLTSTTCDYKTIANLCDVTQDFVSKINRGKCRCKNDIQYPIRKTPVPKKIERNETINRCTVCGKMIKNAKSKYCVDCAKIQQRTVERPEPFDLVKLIVQIGFSGVGKKYGVSDSAVKKWCKQYGLPTNKKEIIALYNTQMRNATNLHKTKRKKSDVVRPVLQIDPISDEIINLFENQSVAARALGFSDGSCIGRVLRGQRELALGYKWKWAP